MFYYYLTYSVYFIFAFFFSILINRLFLKFSSTLGIRNLQSKKGIRWGPENTPSFGGISFYIIFLLSIFTHALLSGGNTALLNQQIIGLVLATTAGFLIGLADDAYNTNPFLKFLGQFICANILITFDIYINISPVTTINYVFTTFWVIGVMNAINMIDNMDGVGAIVSSTIIMAALILIVQQQDIGNTYIFILLAMLAASVGFSFFNWYPSKMYMGDSGSQFLGIFLATISIIFFWKYRTVDGGFIQLKQFLIPLLVFIVPLIDLSTVIIRRMAKGGSPFVGGKDHIAHQLARSGLSDHAVTIILGLLSCLSIIFSLWVVKLFEHWDPLYSFYVIGYFLFVFLIIQLFYIRKGKK